jgi:DNA repair photolyase
MTTRTIKAEPSGPGVSIQPRLPIVLRTAPPDLPDSLKDVVEYRKSGLSLNHVVGCPLDCGYCVRHLFANYDMKRPHLIIDDSEAVRRLVDHWAFQPGLTPIQIFNRATDPFLPGVKTHLFNTLEELDARAITNPVLVITRWHVEQADVERLERLRYLKLTVLVTWSGIDDRRIEPVDSVIAETTLRTLVERSVRTKTILYWRPIIAGVNDTADHLARARVLAGYADATVFTGLFFRDQIREHFRQTGVPDLYDEVARRKILPRDIEERILTAFKGRPLFRKTSCGVAYVHGIADYNGHYGIRELCEICPEMQRGRCATAHHRPERKRVYELASLAHLDVSNIMIDDRCVEVSGSSEQQRYFMQHSLNYQVHDRDHPHLEHRHGRADVGW